MKGQSMDRGQEKTLPPDRKGEVKAPGGRPADPDGDNSCRCEETSEMSPRELIRLMISDLAFWKKARKG